MSDCYPQDRPAFWAMQVQRAMRQALVASELGRDVYLLVMFIAGIEDELYYSQPVVAHRKRLALEAGFKRWEQLNTVRKKAVEAGWLHYQDQGTRQPGIYWSLIPPDKMPREPECKGVQSSGSIVSENGYNRPERIQPIISENGVPLTPTPIKSSCAPGIVSENGYNRPDEVEATDVEHQELLRRIADEFNAAVDWEEPLTRQSRKGLSEALQDPDFREHWPAAIEKLKHASFARGEGPQGWRMSLEDLATPKHFSKLLNGKYDQLFGSNAQDGSSGQADSILRLIREKYNPNAHWPAEAVVEALSPPEWEAVKSVGAKRLYMEPKKHVATLAQKLKEISK